MPYNNNSSVTAIEREKDQLASFADAISSVYGAHGAISGSSSYFANLAMTRFGPFRVGVASGQSIAWSRSRPALDDKWHGDIFVVQQHRGSSTVRHRGKAIQMNPCDLVLIDSVGDCSFEFVGRSTLLSYNLSKDCFSSAPGSFEPMLGRHIDGARGYGRILSSTLRSLAQPDAGFDEDDRAILSEMFVTMLARCDPGREGRVSGKRLRPKLEQLQAWVIENISEPGLTPDVLARQCAVSRRQLYRLFEETGMTPQSWISRIRLVVAHERLTRHRDRSIIEVAFSVGFNDAAHFSRAFRNEYGIPPSLMRKPN